jgi:hypothetical protein
MVATSDILEKNPTMRRKYNTGIRSSSKKAAGLWKSGIIFPSQKVL